MACVDAPLLPHRGGICILPPVLCFFSVQLHFCPPLGKINSFFLFSCRSSSRFLWFRLICGILYSVNPHISLSVFISSFQAAPSFFSSFFFCAACCLHSLESSSLHDGTVTSQFVSAPLPLFRDG